MIETISGVITAILIIILSRFLSKYVTYKLIAATILVAIAFIYVGFSLKDNPVRLIMIEVGVAMTLYFVAIIGYKRNNFLIAYGIIFHGFWDILHYKGYLIGTEIPHYWPSFCLIIDIIDGVYFLMIFYKSRQIAHRTIDRRN